MSNITKYQLTDPDVNIMMIENAYINHNIISLNDDCSGNVFLPTMYVSWTAAQPSHITFKKENTDNIPVTNDILYIFDTWGTSSYYHLFIDHIIPVWVTQHFIQKCISEKNVTVDKSHFLRISNNNYHNELSTTNDIFKYVMKSNFLRTIRGKFRYIIYGYCYTYRPYHKYGIINYFPKYQTILDIFVSEFRHAETDSDQYIIIPERTTRNYNEIDKIYSSLNKKYKVMKVNFGDYSIDKQIQLCSSAFAIIGCEGASFSNQIFMKKRSLVVTLCPGNEMDRNNFHSTLAQYMNHTFKSIPINNETRSDVVTQHIFDIIENHLLTVG